MSSVVCQSCGANAFRWYDTADQVVECKYCHLLFGCIWIFY